MKAAVVLAGATLGVAVADAAIDRVAADRPVEVAGAGKTTIQVGDQATRPTRHTIIIGDARSMHTVAERSVHLIVTSPPYWQLKDYGSPHQIGFDDTYEDYINNLNLVWDECRRILVPGCRLCINIGDQFARAIYYGRYKVIPIRVEIIKFCESIGLDYMGSIIWQKVTTTNTTGGASIMGSYPYPRNGIVKMDYETILLFRKPGRAETKISMERKQRSKLSNAEWNTFFSGHWKFRGERQKDHIAMFPPELPNRLIKMFSFVEDTVLDPFLGSGTTTLSAIGLERNSIGYEINRAFVPIMRTKLALDSADTELNGLFDSAATHSVEFIENPPSTAPPNFRERIAQLPYIFSDPVRIDKRIDPRSLQFGSKINGQPYTPHQYYSVQEIISPNRLQLKNGPSIRLLGIAPIEQSSTQAIDFIRQQTRGKKVFVQYDAQTYDADGSLICYLYVSDKTFINAHLIKRGLVAVDNQTTHKYLNKFAKYQADQRTRAEGR